MVDTAKKARKFEVNGVTVSVRPYWSMGNFAGYVASAYDTEQTYPGYLNSRFLHFGPYGNDEERTCREIAENFLTYYLPSTRISGD